jgi:hypothetical protein
MTDNDRDSALWARLAKGRPPIGPCPDAIDLAGYVDRRLPPADVDALEHHLATCQRCFAAVFDQRTRGASGQRRWPLRLVEVAALAAAMLVVTIGGFLMGGATENGRSQAERAVVQELSFGMAVAAGSRADEGVR